MAPADRAFGSGAARRHSLAFARDPQFALAMMAGPIVWFTAIGTFARPADPRWVLSEPLLFAAFAVAWPLLEEWLFRGMLQPALIRSAWGAREAWSITTANVVTSLIFAAVHLASHPPEWAAATFVPSLIFGYFRDRHGSMAPSAVLHVFYNTGWFLLLGA
jgi:hypothetical protein